MSDFTSALYLGIEHGSRQLVGWERLTLGKPAALESPPGAAAVEKQLAELVGCERVLLAPSTLHTFWDLIAILTARKSHVFMHHGLYPIGRWGVERAAARGVPVTVFRRQDLRRLSPRPRMPVVVADGLCPASGRRAPVEHYLEWVTKYNGVLVIDDTQALGILGHSPGPRDPYGHGGGGLLRYSSIRDQRIVVISSLAKAFGTPVAMLAGSEEWISRFEASSETRVHCSPPSAAAIAAAMNALAINSRWGDSLRFTLASRVSRFRRGLAAMNLTASQGLFPVQPLRLPADVQAVGLYRQLLNCGVRTVLSSGHSGPAHISFVLTARHRTEEVDHALASLEECMARQWQTNSDRRKRQWQINLPVKGCNLNRSCGGASVDSVDLAAPIDFSGVLSGAARSRCPRPTHPYRTPIPVVKRKVANSK